MSHHQVYIPAISVPHAVLTAESYVDSSDSMDESRRKRLRCTDSESSSGSSGDESVCSYQDYLTGSAYDSYEDWQDDVISQGIVGDIRGSGMEYEVASESCMSYSSCSVSSASDVEDVRLPTKLSTAELSCEGYVGDVEYDQSASASQIPVVPSKTWNCLKCKAVVEFPTRYCSPCYRRRMERFKPRPCRKKKPNAALLCSPEQHGEPDEETLSKPGENPCASCGLRSRDGAFVHGKTIHAIFCYPCSKKAYSKRKDCPVCRRTIQHVCQIFF